MNTFYTIFRLNAMPEAKKNSELVQSCCRQCGIYFSICRKCHRGQAYCSDSCRTKGYQRLHREAQKRYREKEKGRQKRRDAERRRRWRLWEKKQTKDNNSNNRKETAKAMKLNTPLLDKKEELKIKKRIGENDLCHLCGREGIIVKKFPRRGY